jgi:hypothetical protein
MKKILLLTTILLFVLFVNTSCSRNVNVTTAGTLSTLLASEEDTTITNLTVTGSIDTRDFKFIRDKMTKLTVLNIKEVTIQAYNGTDGTSTLTNSYPANGIPEFAFSRYNGNGKETLTSIVLPDFVKSIGNYAFSLCYGLKSITIPNSVISIGDGAFLGCNFSSLTIGNSVTLIGNSAFSLCFHLTSLELPNSVTSIGDFAFSSCSKLTSLELPKSVISIGVNAFYGCSGLKTIYAYATTPIVLSSGVYSSVNINACTLHVPAGSKAAYQAADQWGDFYIVEMDPSKNATH